MVRLVGTGRGLGVLAFCIAFALADEALQIITPNRAGELKDVVIDAPGAGVAVASLRVLGTRMGQRLSDQSVRCASFGRKEGVL